MDRNVPVIYRSGHGAEDSAFLSRTGIGHLQARAKASAPSRLFPAPRRLAVVQPSPRQGAEVLLDRLEAGALPFVRRGQMNRPNRATPWRVSNGAERGKARARVCRWARSGDFSVSEHRSARLSEAVTSGACLHIDSSSCGGSRSGGSSLRGVRGGPASGVTPPPFADSSPTPRRAVDRRSEGTSRHPCPVSCPAAAGNCPSAFGGAREGEGGVSGRRLWRRQERGSTKLEHDGASSARSPCQTSRGTRTPAAPSRPPAPSAPRRTPRGRCR